MSEKDADARAVKLVATTCLFDGKREMHTLDYVAIECSMLSHHGMLVGRRCVGRVISSQEVEENRKPSGRHCQRAQSNINLLIKATARQD